MVKVLDRVGPRAAEHGLHLKRHIVHINGQGFEWLERSEASCCDHQKPFQGGREATKSPGSKDLGKSDPEALDKLEEVEGKLYQQDTGTSINVSSGRFDIQFCVKRLSEMMTKPRKLGNFRLAKAGKILCGYTEACAQIRSSRVRRYFEKCRRLRLCWKRRTLFHARRAGIPRTWIRGLHPIKCKQ